MKLTKAKYNWLVAQYNYRKNKEEIIEISDEEYERLTGETFPHTPTEEQDPPQASTIIGTWKGNMAQMENDRWGNNVTSYIESKITFLNNGKTYNGIWTTYYNDEHIKSYFNWNVNNGIIYINFNDGFNGEIRDYMLTANRISGIFWNGIGEVDFELYKLYNSYQCNFVFYTSLHPLPCLLTSILYNPGHFCKFNVTKQNDIYHIQCTRNYDNQYEDIVITTAKESQALHITEFPIIVGKGNFDNNLIAYVGIDLNNDLHLNFTNNGRGITSGEYTYDLDNGVCISNENEQGLYKLKCAYDGTILRVWN